MILRLESGCIDLMSIMGCMLFVIALTKLSMLGRKVVTLSTLILSKVVKSRLKYEEGDTVCGPPNFKTKDLLSRRPPPGMWRDDSAMILKVSAWELTQVT